MPSPPALLPAVLGAAPATTAGASVADTTMWAVTIGLVVALFAVDAVLTRRPHEVGMREAIGWSVFYIAIPLAAGAYFHVSFGSDVSVPYLTGYLVEKSLSVDNLFVFMLLLASFAVPPALQQRALLWGIAGALVLRAVFIALGAALLSSFSWAFLLFGGILIVTAVKIGREALAGHSPEVDISSMRSVRLMRRFMPVVDDYRGAHFTVVEAGRRALTPFALVVVALFATDVVFAVDSVPAVYGITADPYLVFATNAFALLGLRALYFVLRNALSRLVHLSHGLALILAFIGVKLVLHWAHGVWPATPTVPTLWSLLVILVILAVVTTTSLLATRGGTAGGAEGHGSPADAPGHPGAAPVPSPAAAPAPAERHG